MTTILAIQAWQPQEIGESVPIRGYHSGIPESTSIFLKVACMLAHATERKAAMRMGDALKGSREAARLSRPG
jgi:hypothetical protein